MPQCHTSHLKVHRPADKPLSFPRVLLSRLPFTILLRFEITKLLSQWFKPNLLQLPLAMVPEQILLVPLWTMSSPGRFSFHKNVKVES